MKKYLVILFFACFILQNCQTSKPANVDFTPYRTELEAMEKRSIRYRLMLRDSFGYTSPKAKAVIKEMILQDSLDLQRFLILEKQYGFPLYSTVGERAANAGFMVLQHNSTKILSKYIKKLNKLAEKGEASWYNVALMTDRVLCWQNKRQLYGTQYDKKMIDGKERDVIKPIVDFKNLDKRRIKVGLDSFHIYLKEGDYLYFDK